MDLGTVMSVAETLLEVLQCDELKEMCSFLGYKSELHKLQGTVTTIKAVFRDAENKEDELSEQDRHWIQELKDAVYEADDLFDEFLTRSRQKELIKGGKVSKKVRLFFSSYNPLGSAYNMSQRVKKIRNKLDAIAEDHGQFSFKVDSQPIRRRKEQTCSYVYESNIIGRQGEVEEILDHMLDDSNGKQDVSFLAIVGVGGLGKTALAQLLYNHPRVESAFTLKLWTCVSDHDQQQLDIELILRKILAAATGQNHEGNMEYLQNKVRERLANKRYLLVLDDVWTEDRNQWLKLVEFLLGGQRGSWIVVTTRSHETAKRVGCTLKRDLKGLSKEDSWKLFKKIAFAEQSTPTADLVRIGEEIVEGCAGNPLAIRVAASLLYGQDKSKWLSFKEVGLSRHRVSQKDIFPMLKLSYHQLESPLKSCFSYCALFPKDTVISKDLLISLWIAHDYVVPFNDQSLEDAAEEYFSILLHRCFFQDVEVGSDGEIVSCKMHDLMHDVAQEVAGKDICLLNFAAEDVLKKSRHVAYTTHHCRPNSFSSNTCVRSYLQCYDHRSTSGFYKMDQASLKALLTNWTHLRVLDLHCGGLIFLPEAIGELLHLRYLDLSDNFGLEELPKSITKLYNLQTLKLRSCDLLKELPKDLRKLVNLRILDITLVHLTNMPEGMGKLSHLQVLTQFVIDGSKLSQQQWLNQLGELGKLDSLKGKLKVKIKVWGKAKEDTEDGQSEGAYLRGKKHLNRLTIRVEGEGDDEGKARLLEQLQPHPNLKYLFLDWYNADPMMRMPRWANNLATSLPNLIDLRMDQIDVQYLMCLGNMRYLKNLSLENLKNLEYMYEEDSAVTTSNEPTTSMPHDGLPTGKGLDILFPCLERLNLWYLPKLKGWRNSRVGVTDNKHQQDTTGNMTQLSLPQLKILIVKSCPDLICTLKCPNLEFLNLRDFNKKLKVMPAGKVIDDEKKKASAPTSSSRVFSKLSGMEIDNVSWLNSFPREAFQCLMELSIYGAELKSLGEAEEVLRDRLSSLQKLEIANCPNLKSVWCGGLEHLIHLKEFDIQACRNVSLLGNEDTGDNMCLKSLRTLRLACASQLADLEHWVRFLVALESLSIESCEGLESLPNWMPKLASLRKLSLSECSAILKERCQHTTGQDWPYIQHIPSIALYQSDS